jgi:hypothetical protein
MGKFPHERIRNYSNGDRWHKGNRNNSKEAWNPAKVTVKQTKMAISILVELKAL